MNPDAASARVAACSTSKTERVVRGVIALIVASFAISMMGQWWIAIPAGVLAAFLATSSITGWCPADLFPRRHMAAVRENTFGYPEARGHVRVD